MLTGLESDRTGLIEVPSKVISADQSETLDWNGLTSLLHALRLALRAQGATLIRSVDAQCHYVGEDAISPLWLGSTFPQSGCVSGEALSVGAPIALHDIGAGLDWWHPAYEGTFVRALAIVPLAPETGLALGIYWAHPRPVATGEIEIARSFGEVLVSMLAISSDRFRADAELKSRELEYDELAHRHKNGLASAIGIARLTLPGEFAAGFAARMQALDRVQRHLDPRFGSSRQTEMAALFADILAPYQRGDNWPIALRGDVVILSQPQAVAIGLIINELATNALKYGALSRDEGRIDLGWEQAEGQVGILWQERGGPATGDDTHDGVGSRLLRKFAERQLRGEFSRRFMPEGLECRIVFGLD